MRQCCQWPNVRRLPSLSQPELQVVLSPSNSKRRQRPSVLSYGVHWHGRACGCHRDVQYMLPGTFAILFVLSFDVFDSASLRCYATLTSVLGRRGVDKGPLPIPVERVAPARDLIPPSLADRTHTRHQPSSQAEQQLHNAHALSRRLTRPMVRPHYLIARAITSTSATTEPTPPLLNDASFPDR